MNLRRSLFLWLFKDRISDEDNLASSDWWKVMCLPGVGYFSSMGFQPSISLIAAGALAPFATIVLVLITLFGALPAYFRVARESPDGQSSFQIFEKLFDGWKGKILVLIFLGFAATDFIFCITMCASDATVHIMENPWIPRFQYDQVIVTSVLVLILGGIFLRGFKSALAASTWIVGFYLFVNLILLTYCSFYIASQPQLVFQWFAALSSSHPDVTGIIVASCLAFPHLALGLSGLETSVTVMPLIKTETDDLEERLDKTRRMLLLAVGIMTIFLLFASFATTVLIPPDVYKEGGSADGRALAYLAHTYLGSIFGVVYDAATVAILCYAGASGMAALTSLVPLYLPRYGMAPDWALAKRPLVIVLTIISLIVTWFFGANVDAQAGAFATGLLVLVSSAPVAVTLVVMKESIAKTIFFILSSLIFVGASLSIMVIRPDGLQIALFFIAMVIGVSLLSRALRSTELRVGEVIFDENTKRFLEEARGSYWGEIRILSHKPDDMDYSAKEAQARRLHSIQSPEGNFIFLEVTTGDVSEFRDEKLELTGVEENGFQIVRCNSLSVPNAIAAILLKIRNDTGAVPHIYFGWTEGHPLLYILKYVLFGEGETAPLTREILRSAEDDAEKRPVVHVA